MTNEELLAGFLDRSLSEDDLLELEARAKAQPELARELRELVAMESRIKKAAPAVLFPTSFLAAVENSIAASIAAAALTAGVAGAATATGISSWLPIVSIAALGVAGVGTAAYFIASSPAQPEAAPRLTPVVAPAPTAVPQPPQVIDHPAEVRPASPRQPALRSADVPQPSSVTPNDQANLQGKNPPSAIDRARERFEQSSGLDRVQAGLALARIDTKNAEAILTTVQHVADEHSLRQYQAEVRIRRAAIAKPSNAAVLYRDAIRYGTNVVPQATLDEWKRQLDALDE